MTLPGHHARSDLPLMRWAINHLWSSPDMLQSVQLFLRED